MSKVDALEYRALRIRTGTLCFALLLSVSGVFAQTKPDFSGLWRQDNERSQPKRSSDVTLRIEHRGPDLTVETTIARGARGSRHALQKYTTDGKVSISAGADGDEFHTSIVWMGQSLVFQVEEHEDGRILRSRETWTLRENGSLLERVREPLDAPSGGAGKQTLIYLREAPQS